MTATGSAARAAVAIRASVIDLLHRGGILLPLRRTYVRALSIRAYASERPPVAPLMRAWRRHHPTPTSEPRSDPLPRDIDFPEGRYVFIVDSITPQYGGRVASLLARARLIHALGGVTGEILMADFVGDLDELTAALRNRGVMAPGLVLHDLRQYGPPDASLHQRLDAFIDADEDRTRPVYFVIDWRGIDRQMLRYSHPRAAHIFALHSTHLAFPYDNRERMLPQYRLALEQPGKVVFLTN